MPTPLPLDGEIYLEKRKGTLGIHETARTTTLETFWQAKALADGRVEMTLLDMDKKPTPIQEVVELPEFQTRFLHLPGFLSQVNSSKDLVIERIIEIAEGHYQKHEYNSAEYEFQRALKLDEDSVRANFGLGLTYMAQGDLPRAREVFLRLANLPAVYDRQHKHLFNEFGIMLRRAGLYHESLEHYHRALKIAADDENLWFNLGRALHADGRPDLTRVVMKKALSLNPQHEAASWYLDWLDREPAAAPPAAAPPLAQAARGRKR
ncbi:MAG: tetratricopeptide repeat protein [Deltaproteobacteria bacterium]|nr:tetratricopeptide repeat protein [Deltaproteobacteria bacterium]